MARKLRPFPIVLRFAIVALLGYDVYVFYYGSLTIKLYSAIVFLILTNGWAASENDASTFNDLFLLDETLCLAIYYLMLLDLNNGNHLSFWMYSAIIFILYFLWNVLLLKYIDNTPEYRRTIRSFNICNAIAFLFTSVTYGLLFLISDKEFVVLAQITGGILWTFLLLKWYYDTYFAPEKDVLNAKSVVTNTARQSQESI